MSVRDRVPKGVEVWSLPSRSGRVRSLEKLEREDGVERTEVGLFQETKLPEYTNLTRVSLLGAIRGIKFQTLELM